MEPLEQSWRKTGIFNLALEKDRLDELSYIQEIHQLLSNLNVYLPLVNSTQ